jgi:hypothetical protein
MNDHRVSNGLARSRFGVSARALTLGCSIPFSAVPRSVTSFVTSFLAAVVFAGSALFACSAGGGKKGEVTVKPGDAPASEVDFGDGEVGSPNAGGGIEFGDLAEGPGVDPEFTGIPECESCSDFPAQPIFEDGLGPDVQNVFNQASTGTGPCILEPQEGMMIPANMLRPRVRFTGQGTLHQITFHTAREANDLVVYTTKNPWIMPPDVWKGIAKNVFEEDITVTVKTSNGNLAPSESRVNFRIAPVQAGGSMVYWGATTEQPGLTTTRLLAFGVGEEAVVTALRPADVKETMLGDNAQIKREEYGAPKGQARCVGCHTSTGDGSAVITADHWPWNLAVTDITQGTGGRPAMVTEMGAFLLQMPWLGVSTTSRGDWALGNRIVVTSAGPRNAMNANFTPNVDNPQQDMAFGQSQNQTGRDGLIWIDLAAAGTAPARDVENQNEQKEVGRAMVAELGQGWGVIQRTGDPRGAVTPDWSHDGTRIVYTSTDSTKDGHIGDNANEVDIYTVPYNDKLGGAAAPLAGASAAGVAEYYPDFSADDRFVAFARVENGRGRIYYHPQGEIYVVPSAGGTALRLAANDPPLCSGETSPGVTNSWAKWSPTVRGGPVGTPHEGKHYYFLLFSSARQSPFRLGQGPASQLYLTTLVELPNGELQTYPAMYLWNQSFEITDSTTVPPTVSPVQTSNLTPAFDEFVIPPRPPVIVR